MKRKAKLIPTLFLITFIIIIIATHIYYESKQTSQNERITQICYIDCFNDALDFLTDYKNSLQEKDLYMAAGCFYSFVKIYEDLPESMYNADVHLLINQIWLKLYLESNISEKEIDILIKGISILVQDINSLEAQNILLQLFN